MKNEYSLTLAQRPVWFEQKLYPESAMYNIGGYIKIRGALEVSRFTQALRAVVAGADIFRIRFSEQNGSPVQSFAREADAAPEVRDFSTEPDPEKSCLLWMRERHAIPLPAEGSALFEFSLLKQDESTWYWYIKLHHLLTDGWGISVLVGKVAEAYSNGTPGTETFRYEDYIKDNAAYPGSASFQKDREYWEQVYKTLPPPLSLGSRAKGKPAGSARKTACIRRETYNSLIRLSADSQVTVFHLLLGALYTYISRVTGVSDIVFGLPVLNRGKASYKKTIGLFAGITPFRLSPSGDISFRDLLSAVRNGLKETYKYQQYPVDEIIRKVKQAGHTGELYEISFSYERHDYDVRFGDMETERLALPHNEERLPLALYVREYDEKRDVQIDFDYNLSCWDEFHIEQLVRHYVHLLETICRQADRRLPDIEILPEEDIKKQLVAFNNTRREYPADKTFLHLFAEKARQVPGNAAVTFKGESLTYEALDRDSSLLASALKKRGARPEARIAILAGPSFGMITGLIGILKSGAAFLPVDPRIPAERLDFMLADSGAEMLITDGSAAHQSSGSTEVLKIKDLISAEEQNPSGLDVAGQDSFPDPSSLAYVIYTSGSTGTPKGIMTEHRSLLNLCLWFNDFYSVQSSDRATKYAAFGFDASVFEIFPFLLAGASIYPVPEEIRLDMEKLSHFYETNKISLSFLPTPVCEQFMQADNRSLRVLYTGGDKLRTFIPRAYKLYNNYGPAENTVLATACEIRDAEKDIPIGKPVYNNSVFILDEQKRLLPLGATGELCISGDSLARGYLNNQELTRQKFIENPFFPGERMYCTGDLARWRPDGSLEYAGRKDEQVKIRGNRIELSEIERRLYGFEGVKQAAVKALEDPSGNRYLTAYVSGAPELTEASLKAWIGKALPDYMIPSFIVFLDQLPLSPNLKIDRSALPAPKALSSPADIAEPVTEEEKALAEVWKDLLGTGRIGIKDNFFTLGGDSIKAIQASSRLRALGFAMEVKDLFEFPVLERAALCLRKTGAMQESSEFAGALPLLPVQKWFFLQQFREEHHWNQGILLKCKGHAARPALEKALTALIRKHGALRISFSKTDKGVEQYCHPFPESFSFEVSVTDLSGVADYKGAIKESCTRIHSSMDMSRFPLLKAALFKTPEGDHLFLAMHHLITDGVSWRILLEDLETAYDQASGKEEVLPAPARGSLLQWTRALDEYMKGPGLLSEIPYWIQLNGKGKRYGRMERKSSLNLSLALDTENTGKLLKEAHVSFGTNVQDLLLSALLLVLKKRHNGSEILLNLETHGRAEMPGNPDVSDVIGWFTAFFPVSFSLPEGDSDILIKSVKEQVRRVPRKGIGYNMLRFMETGVNINLEVYPEISFNYLGEFGDAGSSFFSFSEIPCGDMQSPLSHRLYPLDINAMVRNGQLVMEFSFDTLEYNEDSSRQLITEYRSALLHIIEYCTAKNRVEYTPSDFGDTELGIDELDNILGQIDNL